MKRILNYLLALNLERFKSGNDLAQEQDRQIKGYSIVVGKHFCNEDDNMQQELRNKIFALNCETGKKDMDDFITSRFGWKCSAY